MTNPQILSKYTQIKLSIIPFLISNGISNSVRVSNFFLIILTKDFSYQLKQIWNLRNKFLILTEIIITIKC